jgi:hypothetical protein
MTEGSDAKEVVLRFMLSERCGTNSVELSEIG